MKLVFRKDQEQNVLVAQQVGTKEHEFSYVDMIKYLIKHGDLAEPELVGDFTEAEVTSVRSMVSLINEEVNTLKVQWANDD